MRRAKTFIWSHNTMLILANLLLDELVRRQRFAPAPPRLGAVIVGEKKLVLPEREAPNGVGGGIHPKVLSNPSKLVLLLGNQVGFLS